MPLITQRRWQELRELRQCWNCMHNEVSDQCNDCLLTTVVFEKSDGVLGEFKPNYEKGQNWNKYPGKF